MRIFRPILRPCLVALVAIAAALSMAKDVSAKSSTSTGSTGTRSCCLKRVCKICCCPPARPTRSSQTSGSPAAHRSQRVAVADLPAIPCECRSSDPARPAPLPESRSEHRPSDNARAEAVQATSALIPAFTPARPAFDAPTPVPTAPLYLRNARLLI